MNSDSNVILQPIPAREKTASLMDADDKRALRDTLRRFVEKEMPREAARDWDKRDFFPKDVFDRLASLGVMGLTIPEDYGGAGRSVVGTMIVIEELARRSMAVAVPYIMCACYAGMNLLECGSEKQKRTFLPKVAAGKLLFAYGLTEPDVGADLASVATRAERRGDTIVINGAKRFCSGPRMSDYIYALVRSGPAAERYRNLSLVLVPPTSKGVEIEDMQTLGLRGVPTSDVRFTDVAVPAENIVGGDAGWNAAWGFLSGPALEVEKLEVAALALGVAEAALDDTWEYSQQRRQFGKPICTYQSIRHTLAEGRTKIHAARLLLHEAAELADLGQPYGLETSMAKLFVCEIGKEVVLNCQSIFGAYGYVVGIDMERYVRDILLMPIIGGSSAIQKNNIANRLRLPR